jgi:hypothetical protein
MQDDESHDERDDSHPPARKRQRVRLSCLECRRRKLSCSRELPCDRCIKSGTADRCTYESRGLSAASVGDTSALSFSAGPSRTVVAATSQSRDAVLPHRDLETSLAMRDAAKDHDRLRKLELEIAQLRAVVAKQAASIDGSTAVASPATTKDVTKESPSQLPLLPLPPFLKDGRGDGLEFNCIRGRNFKTRFFGCHCAWSSFSELAGIQPFMKETAEEWLRPLNISKKDRMKRKEQREKQFLEPDPALEVLLPPRVEMDSLVAVYIDQFEQLHRIIHIPSFKRDYEAFWDPSKPRYAAFTALLLAMLSVSSCLDMQTSSSFVGVKSTSYQTAERWVKACDAWLDGQSHKHRRLIHYQIFCMLYLAKKVNVIKKKRFWTSAGALVRDGITIGLHQDSEHIAGRITPYYREMRRRLWATMVEFDVQISFELGLPTILNQINNEAGPPRNIDDETFDEDSDELPAPKSPEEYTISSYQNLSRHSLQTRLELIRLQREDTHIWKK